MDRRIAQAWRAAAAQALSASRTLTSENVRGMCNRLYYAMFSHAHALLIEAGKSPREHRGTWSHTKLPGFVDPHLRSYMRASKAREYRALLLRARQFREYADYHPGLFIESIAAIKLFDDVESTLGNYL